MDLFQITLKQIRYKNSSSWYFVVITVRCLDVSDDSSQCDSSLFSYHFEILIGPPSSDHIDILIQLVIALVPNLGSEHLFRFVLRWSGLCINRNKGVSYFVGVLVFEQTVVECTWVTHVSSWVVPLYSHLYPDESVTPPSHVLCLVGHPTNRSPPRDPTHRRPSLLLLG